MKDEKIAAMEALLVSGKRREALSALGSYLKAEGALGLSREVERAGRSYVGGFSLDDILALSPLDEEQAEMVMERLADEYDPEIGMNWEQVKETITFVREWDFASRAKRTGA